MAAKAGRAAPCEVPEAPRLERHQEAPTCGVLGHNGKGWGITEKPHVPFLLFIPSALSCCQPLEKEGQYVLCVCDLEGSQFTCLRFLLP